jgi:hypothetical protein
MFGSALSRLETLDEYEQAALGKAGICKTLDGFDRASVVFHELATERRLCAKRLRLAVCEEALERWRTISVSYIKV